MTVAEILCYVGFAISFIAFVIAGIAFCKYNNAVDTLHQHIREWEDNDD